jgi:ARG/rhodanese/phosphatase superfamily protein
MKTLIFWGTFCAVPVLLLAANFAGLAGSGQAPISGDYKLLTPITHGDLTIFPVVSSKAHDTSGFLTLDEGIRSGEVVVTEAGNLHGAMRRRPGQQFQPARGAQVNTLVLVNNSKLPLLLLAGEVVTGGKQDRVVGKDRIIPAESDPVDLAVFCVEPGRWIEKSTKFDTHASIMAQPSVRKKAMADADQQKVWDEVNSSKAVMSARVAPPPKVSGGVSGGGGGGVYASDPGTVRALASTTSYATVVENSAVKKQVDSITGPMQKSYESVIKQLRNQNAVGVVVAVRGHIVWVDIFASPQLLSKYWPKLLQSYAAEALTSSGARAEVSTKDAQQFLEDWQARHETVESEPGLYRQRELRGERFRAFELTSLLPNKGFDVHLSKMAE